MLKQAHAAAPAECCGVLLGTDERIVDAVPCRNLSADPNRFLIDPAEHIAARRSARDRELAVLGFYHSHPHSEPVPSPSDVAEVTYDGCLYLIVGGIGGGANARLFRMDRDGPAEIALTIEG